MEYPTLEEKLIMPEYGRNVQHLVEHALTLEDREERNRCAQSIIRVMASLFPEQQKNEELNKKLWDHLALMSNYQLDVDYPYGRPEPDDLLRAPERLSMTRSHIRRAHYGRLIATSIERIRQQGDPEVRRQMAVDVANQMKRDYLLWNLDTVDDAKIFQDLYELTDGAVDLASDGVQLISQGQLLQEKQQMEKLNNGKKKKKN
ncbi:MAG: DUF4290 domain-containing protein, partial [Paludibacteraceae bacterium]|nr:DUF4290 domain-containing protein [Paludibacteraceae bacterium]